MRLVWQLFGTLLLVGFVLHYMPWVVLILGLYLLWLWTRWQIGVWKAEDQRLDAARARIFD